MRLRTIAAPDMQVAMEQIRASMGDEAVILSSKPAPGGQGIHVTVAVEDREEDAADHGARGGGAAPTNANGAGALLNEIEAILEFHSTPDPLLGILMQTARHINFERDTSPEGVTKGVAKLLDAAFRFSPLPVENNGFAMMLIGPPGIGKTMAVAKMAAQLVAEQAPLAVISTDNTRAGGVEQLSAFTGILGLELGVAVSPLELRRCLKECGGGRRIIIDSAGANPYDPEQLRELETLLEAAANVEPVLAVPAGLDGAEARHIAETFAALGARRMLVSRADTARRYGSLLAAAHHAELALCNISGSPRVVEGVPALDARRMARLLTRNLQ